MNTLLIIIIIKYCFFFFLSITEFVFLLDALCHIQNELTLRQCQFFGIGNTGVNSCQNAGGFSAEGWKEAVSSGRHLNYL